MCCDGFRSVADKLETNGTDEVEKLKSAWHNVKYSWVLKSKTAFSCNSPIFLLGKCYHLKAVDDESPTESCTAEELDDSVVTGNVDGFRKDFSSRVWLTYREEFPALPGSTLTSDCGRGGTLRAGQINLAQALLLHILSIEWTWSEALTLEPLDTETWTSSAARRLAATLEASILPLAQVNQQPLCAAQGGAEEADSYLQEAYHRTFMSWFGDGPSAQLGIHRLRNGLVFESLRCTALLFVCLCCHRGPCVTHHQPQPDLTSQIKTVNLQLASCPLYDRDMYSADVIDSHSGWTASHSDPQGLNSEAAPDGRAFIILIPLRLGGEKINPGYLSVVKSILSLEYCIGVFGGKPKQAYFFVGFQDDSLIYMDPHYCQSFVDVSTSDFPLQSFHCPSPKKMSFSKIDPSCTIRFYSKNVEHYERISTELSMILQPSSKEKYPPFTFMMGHGKDYELSIAVEKRKWPFIRDTRKAGTTSGDFVLLLDFTPVIQNQVMHHKSRLDQSVFTRGGKTISSLGKQGRERGGKSFELMIHDRLARAPGSSLGQDDSSGQYQGQEGGQGKTPEASFRVLNSGC
ncbi:cysteine protease ATG4C-like [Carassius carassius]|uniref:cysteine protease ATG4C-like n=1 Tax=Carassius carassius TaxID=217509 RepID=UPI002868A96E|nr:cysteine protease ATG4C-like [Carassius carassius]